MSQHLPIRIIRPLQPFRRQCLFQRPATTTSVRPFSSTPAHQRSKRSQKPDASHVKAQAENEKVKAPATLQQEAFESENMMEQLDDIGLLPGTFIRSWSGTPSLLPNKFTLSEFKTTLGRRWKYEWIFAKTRLSDFVGNFRYKWWMRKGKRATKPKQVFVHSEVRAKAKEYYEKLYQDFASKNEKRLPSFCTGGLVQTFKSRFTTRPSHVRMTWRLLSHHRLSPRVVSNRATLLPIPGADDRETPSAVRQVVLRISTQQSLTIEHDTSSLNTTNPHYFPAWTPDGARKNWKGKNSQRGGKGGKKMDEHTKDMVEYIVMQRRMWKGKEEPWKVWGFVEKTTVESIERDTEKTEQMMAYDAAHPNALGA